MPIIPDTADTARLTIPEPQEEVSAQIEPRFWPAIPHSMDDLNLSPRVISDLFLRRVYMEGTSTLSSVSRALRLSPTIIDKVFRHFRDERVLDVRGSTVDDDYAFSLTTAGTRLAVSRMRLSQYVGPAPVSLAQYVAAVRAQKANVTVTKEVLTNALSDLVITEDLVATLGPALVSQKTMFLYGPTGNGKTVIAERLHRIYKDTVLIPYAVEVDGQIIVLHDPIVHKTASEQPDDIDPRWVLCSRPFVVVGGELTSDMLELRFDDASRTYAAPVQMKANNGVLVIDDFGRQVISPRKMLNRWIVPMDRRIDFLSLRYGVKFEIPFELMLVFSTNLEPHHLADEAFLRRMHNKIFLGGVNDTVFDQIFHRFIESRGFECDADSSEYLRKLCREAGCNPLRACLPADLCLIARWVNQFNERPGYLSKDDFTRAVQLYFARTTGFVDRDFIPTA
ncbi:MAG TPA: AAA family ATPase [Bryobacteraceae bacterium]|nr:AAA family ATPase [Bryobacteraceae bacterium]